MSQCEITLSIRLCVVCATPARLLQRWVSVGLQLIPLKPGSPDLTRMHACTIFIAILTTILKLLLDNHLSTPQNKLQFI